MRTNNSKILRYPIKVLLFLVAGLCVLKPASEYLAGIVPALSPFVGIMSAVSLRMLTPFFLICLPVLLMIFLKKRWFCIYACPTGLLLELAGKGRSPEAKRKHSAFPRVSKCIVAVCFVAALFGFPFLVWLDPLSLLSSFFGSINDQFVLADAISMAGLLLLIALSIWRPNLWCGRICPLGASQDLVSSLATIGKKEKKEELGPRQAVFSRRVLFIMASVAFCESLIRKTLPRSNVIRPPGAMPEKQFTAVCSRCGTCAAVCPAKIIRPDMGESGAVGFMTPVVTISKKYCSELCNRCGEVCPTNAIAHNSLEEKQNISIGVAEVISKACVGWEDGEHCMVCSDFCPYGAVKGVLHNDVLCPEVIEDKCRGCGACELVCPASESAIIVRGREQRRLEPVKVKVVNDFIQMMG